MKRGYVLGVLVLSVGGAVAATNAEIRCAVIGAGGGTSTSPHHVVRSVVGTPGAGTSTSPTHRLRPWGTPCPAAVLTALDDTGAPAAVLRLHPNAPNPFNPRTVIRYDVPMATQHVRLRIYDLAGRLVRILVDGPRPAGTQEVVWNGRDDAGRAVASGVYVVRIRTKDQSMQRKMTLLK